jgi:hypothetical protein
MRRKTGRSQARRFLHRLESFSVRRFLIGLGLSRKVAPLLGKMVPFLSVIVVLRPSCTLLALGGNLAVLFGLAHLGPFQLQ